MRYLDADPTPHSCPPQQRTVYRVAAVIGPNANDPSQYWFPITGLLMRMSGLIKILIARVDSAKESDRSHACVRRISTLRDLRAGRAERNQNGRVVSRVGVFVWRATVVRSARFDWPQSKEERTVVFFTLCDWIHDARVVVAHAQSTHVALRFALMTRRGSPAMS